MLLGAVGLAAAVAALVAEEALAAEALAPLAAADAARGVEAVWPGAAAVSENFVTASLDRPTPDPLPTLSYAMAPTPRGV